MNKNKILIALKILVKPKKIISYILLKGAYKFRLLNVPMLPVTLDIEPNNWCNFACNHCQVTHWDKEKTNLSIGNFNQILNQFPNLIRVKVQGMGEPFLNKSTIDMLEVLDKQGISGSTISNGSIMSKSLLDRISKLDNTRIFFSIDGGNKEVFEKIRINGNFDKVKKNIKALTTKCPKINVTLWSVITKENIHDYESIIEAAKSFGVNNLVFQTFLSNWGKEGMEEIINEKSIQQENFKEMNENSPIKARNMGVNLQIFKENYMTKEKPCNWPWTSMFIDSAGDVVPCCVLADAKTINFGNVLKTDVKEIWNSDSYKEFRKMHRDFEIPDICKECYKITS